jgi:hypothetical protein
MDLQAPPGDARLFIAERPGRIRVVQGGVLLPASFLDIASRVTVQGEAFGPDGMLYLSTGDGGGGGDTFMNSQNTLTHLAKLLRLDVSTPPYTIPPDNPVFPGASQNENWAMRLRNPFRYAFDVPSGQLYIADVGQDQREEIDVVPANSPGVN